MTLSLVTGGAGFIGSHLVLALLAQQHQVRVLDNFSTGSADHLAEAQGNIDVVHGDVRDYKVVCQAMQGVEYVFHQAAPIGSTGPTQALMDPMEMHHSGATGTLHVLMAAQQNQVRRVLYASSCCVYGEPTYLLRREDELVRPLSPYAVAKLTGEQHCLSFTGTYGLETVILRYFNVYGPRERHDSPYASQLTHILTTMLAGHRPIIQGTPQEMLDLTYVDDAVHATLLAATAPRVAGKVYNIGSGHPISSVDLVAMLNTLLGTQIQPLNIFTSRKDRNHHLADIQKAEIDLGFCAATPLEKGLRRHVEFSLLSGPSQ
jgi:UDP-glucose 4-epimerase